VHGGAAYNLLPILQDGRPGRPCAIRKETGLNSASPSRPGYVAFTSGADRIFALDQGAATLSVFSTQPEMPVLSRLSLGESSIPLSLASYMQGNLLFVVDRESGSLLTVRHDPANASLSRQSDVIQGDFLGPAAVHAASKTLFLVAADSIYNYRIQAETGELTLLQRLRNTQPYGQTQHLLCDDEDHVLYLPTSQGVAGSNIDPECGHISPLKRVAPSAHTIALL
ncbi:MAG TPA: beta-propeller fold lactonase family protein, partial [Acidobacteriaceae bacterium]